MKNKTVNIYVVQMRNLNTDRPYELVGVYSTKKLADTAGKEACEMYEGKMHYTIHILPLDDEIIN